MIDDGATTTRSGQTRRAADPERVRMTWTLGPGRGLIARWDTTDERRRCLDRPRRRTAA